MEAGRMNFTISWDMDGSRWEDEEELSEEEADEEEADGAVDVDDAEDAGSEEASVEEDAAEETDDVAASDGPDHESQSKPVGREVKVMINDDLVTLSGKEEYVYVDIFDFIDFNLQDSRGRKIITKLNGNSADYMEMLRDGDQIEVYWEESGKKK